MVEISLVLDNGKVYTIKHKEVVEIAIQKIDMDLDLEYLKVVVAGNRPEITDILLMDTLFYEKEHKIKEIVIGDKVYNNEGKGYNSLCTIDNSGYIVIELLNEDSFWGEFKCKSDPEHLERVMTEYIELVALIERIVTKLAFKDKKIDVEKVVALCSVYDFLISLDDINLVGFSCCVDSMLIHKYFKETPEGIKNERIEEIISKKSLFKYGFVVNNKVIKNAINIITEHFIDYSLDNLKNMIKVYEELFMHGEKIGFCDYENYEEETAAETTETAKTNTELSEELFGFVGDISEVHYSGSVDGYDCFE